MKTAASIFVSLIFLLLAAPLFAGTEKETSSEAAAATTTSEPFKFHGEFDLEESYIGGADLQRAARDVNDADEYYSNLRLIWTPRILVGYLRLGAQWERYSFGYPEGGQQLPNTLQALNAVVGLDTRFGDSILVRLEAQPGFYGTSFDHFDGDQFNIPFVLGGTYVYRPELQFVMGIGVNFQQRYPVLPGGGVRWKFAPKWVLNAVLPTPRLEYALNPKIKLFGGADIKANTFRVDDHFGDSHGNTALNNAWVSYSEFRVGTGIEYKLTDSFALTLEGGYLPYRNFDYHRTDVRYHSESGAPYGSVMLHGAF